MTALDDIRDLVQHVADGHFTVAEALDALRTAGRNPNAEHLEEAVALTQTLDGLRGGSVDPLHFLDAEPKIGFDSWQVAVDQAAAGLAFALAQLGRKPEAARS